MQDLSCQNCGQTPEKLLSRVVYPDPFVSGLYNVQNFYYDQSKRCTKIETGLIDSNSAVPVFTVNTRYSFYYNGADKNPVSVDRRVPTAVPSIPRSFYFFYDQHGKKIKDSSRLSTFTEKVIDINRNSNTIITTPDFTNLSLDNSYFDTLTIRNSNIEIIRTRIFRETGKHEYQLTESGFDQGINPFNKLNINESFFFSNSSIGYSFLGPGLTRYIGFSRNNCTGYSINGIAETSIQYSYDTQQYPVIAVATYKGTNYKQVAYFEYYP
jgi:hypothetical protein